MRALAAIALAVALGTWTLQIVDANGQVVEQVHKFVQWHQPNPSVVWVWTSDGALHKLTVPPGCAIVEVMEADS